MVKVLIVQLDNGAFHKAKRWVVPPNIILLFQHLAIPAASLSRTQSD
jgi:hypothetical protein